MISRYIKTHARERTRARARTHLLVVQGFTMGVLNSDPVVDTIRRVIHKAVYFALPQIGLAQHIPFQTHVHACKFSLMFFCHT